MMTFAEIKVGEKAWYYSWCDDHVFRCKILDQPYLFNGEGWCRIHVKIKKGESCPVVGTNNMFSTRADYKHWLYGDLNHRIEMLANQISVHVSRRNKITNGGDISPKYKNVWSLR